MLRVFNQVVAFQELFCKMMLLVSLSCHDIDDRWKQENNNIKNNSFYKENEKTERAAHFCRFLCLHCATKCVVKVDRNDNVIITLISKIVNCFINKRSLQILFLRIVSISLQAPVNRTHQMDFPKFVLFH